MPGRHTTGDPPPRPPAQAGAARDWWVLVGMAVAGTAATSRTTRAGWANPARPPHTLTLLRAITRSAHVWEEMEKAGVPDVKGVWSHEPGPRQFTVVAIKQRYPGHAKQAGMLASQCFSGGYQNRFTIVVDDDIDPTRIDDVVWALSTRCDPAG